MAQYVVTITNGAGSRNLPAGLYDVTANVTGYAGVLDPDSFTATTSTGSESFTLAATGTLTLTVNETGASGGTPITSGSFIRCSADGLTTYGTAKTVSGIGECVFDHVPFGDGVTPYTIYVLQLTSDGEHNIHSGVIAVDMEASTQGEYVQNSLAAEQDFALEDAYYSGLNLSGSLTFDGPQ